MQGRPTGLSSRLQRPCGETLANFHYFPIGEKPMMATYTSRNFGAVFFKHFHQLAPLKPYRLLGKFGTFPVWALDKDKKCGIVHTLKLYA